MRDNLAVSYPTFVELSRSPSLKTKGTMVDPTLRDNLDNGMEATRARFTRMRRQWTVTIDFLTAADVTLLTDFVQFQAVYGAAIFLFLDQRDPDNPVWLTVRFASLPTFTDVGWVGSGFSQSVSFELREV